MAGDDHDGDEPFDDGFGDDYDAEFDERPLDEHETTLVQRDLEDLSDFEETFRPEGYRGVAVFCHDCVEEHYYEWDMLRENLQMLIESGETPVHEPAFAPDPVNYVPWDYARGYVDALRDAGVGLRLELDRCERCSFTLPSEFRHANFCPRCGSPLLQTRIAKALHDDIGLDADDISRFLMLIGLPTGQRGDED